MTTQEAHQTELAGEQAGFQGQMLRPKPKSLDWSPCLLKAMGLQGTASQKL